MRISEARASSSSGSFLPSIASARCSSFSIAGGVERLENQHARARQQRRDQLEGRIFGRGADQNDGAVLDHRQKRILLRAVEAVNLVDEKERPLPGFAPRARGIEDLLQVGDAGKDRRDLLEMQIGRLRQQPRHRGLAGAGRTPEDERAERARLQHAGESAVRTEQMILPDHIGELVGTKLVGERPRRAAVEPGGGEQAWGLGFGPGGHRLGSSPSPQGERVGVRGCGAPNKDADPPHPDCFAIRPLPVGERCN